MYLDLISSDNNIIVNINIAKLFGIKVAIYWAELTNILSKVHKKGKYDEAGFFKIDRKYVENKTTLTFEEQFNCDHELAKAGIIEADFNDTNRIRVNVEAMISLVTSEDTKLLTAIAKKIKATKVSEAVARANAIKESLKRGIVEQNPQLLEAFRNWIDSLFAQKKQITKQILDVFQRTIKDYTDQLAIQLQLVEIATIHAYADASWAIDQYERNYRNKSKIAPQKQSVGINEQIVF